MFSWRLQVKALVTELTALKHALLALPVRSDKVIKALEEATSTYCLCEMPFREGAEMIECEACTQWFHFGCIGIDHAKEPKRFACPGCCGEKGMRYPYEVRSARLFSNTQFVF